MDTIAVILAAGKGTRMRSELPKVLVSVCGRPLVEYVLDAVEHAGIRQSLVVVGYRGDLVRTALANRRGVEFVEQAEQKGTGHAVGVCRERLQSHHGAVLVVTGDSPFTQSSSLKELLRVQAESNAACVLGTLLKDDPHGLGRIVRDKQGGFLGIVEEKDASAVERTIREVNMSTYVFACQPLLAALQRLRNDNLQGEYYVTDCPGILRADGLPVRALPILKSCEALSINSPDELEAVEMEMRRQLCVN